MAWKTTTLSGLGAVLLGTGLTLAQGLPIAAEPEGRQGGDNCTYPTVIEELPYHVTGTTEGYTDDYDETCPHNAPGSPDVVYAFTPTTDLTVNISLCYPGTEYDTKLYVYKGTCGGAYVACNDDDCPGYVSQILDLPLTAGETYYIIVDGYGGEFGSYELTVMDYVPLPACPEYSLFSQPARVDGDAWAGTSEASTNYLRYESYEGIAEETTISYIRFWGLPVYYDGFSWSLCSEDPMPFDIKFYEDDNGQPGAEECSYALQIAGTITGLQFNGFPLYEYGAALGTPCDHDQPSGWVSIQGGGDPDCWFLWMSSPFGDGTSLVDDGSGLKTVDVDLSLCLGDDTGACCCTDGTCDILTEADCARLLRGDANCDELLDFWDINPFVAVLSGGEPCLFSNCDVNGDGAIDFEDINPFVMVLSGGDPITGNWLGMGTSCDQCPR